MFHVVLYRRGSIRIVLEWVVLYRVRGKLLQLVPRLHNTPPPPPPCLMIDLVGETQSYETPTARSSACVTLVTPGDVLLLQVFFYLVR